MTPATTAATRNSHPVRAARAVWLAAAIATALTVFATRADGQRGGNTRPAALKGSRASVEKMYDFATRNRYPFYLTPTNLEQAIAQGRLVELPGDSTYEISRGVQENYATREAKQFVTQFAPQYLHACGVPLTVTSAARAMSRQPHNANPHSVHPAGIAVDFRRPPSGPCLTWMRNALSDLESKGIIEATEERHPVHLHVAVLAAPGARVALPNLVLGMVAAARVPAVAIAAAAVPQQSHLATADIAASVTKTSTSAASTSVSVTKTPSTYLVRQGDTLYDIAQRTGVSIRALAEANHRSLRGVLKPGTTLRLPAE